ncbi:dihydroxyacetone kinase subunit DhaK [Acetobacter oeni]|uniref:Dihydroxyacetone kinase n=1 Tax=Acetobacter oeni TaxID=304077 RepID=A0A511XNS6_9PROT|nr:dihydroxyacetone kinase subunit DhaK [Acetobacter oeni]MBB3881634.1 dihydroxyacetone kinase [Acetobacter oeni]NHO17556.1 DAK2 domain-containing protein [Acetobacter oeni]GBR00974.1 dihydroxyacetone kinase [Acetobacter oeni LMG 21952]GEN64611.1 dihydroxyacetone kinase [Acetobacter oeni]
MKRFLNSRETLVTEALDGLLRSPAGASLCRLDGYPDIRVLIRKDWDKDCGKVAVLSGGGSGHEPAHAGFVGKGMLTGAVCGSLFASPGVDAILAGILAVTGKAGCLLVVKNYTGDRLNFGLAAEQARDLGLKVEMVIVGDDISLPEHRHARGVAGTVLAHKIAGHLAESGANLEKVTSTTREAIGKIRSIGLSLSDCYTYDEEFETRLGEDEVELGLGIHGEPGAKRIEMADANKLMRLAADELTAILPESGDAKHALMLNNLGTTSILEMLLLLEAFSKTKLASKIVLVAGPSHFLTALDMNGFSLSLIELTDEIEAALRSPVGPTAWTGMAPWHEPATVPVPAIPDVFSAIPSANPILKGVVQRGATVLLENEDALNALDAKIGDGDAGSTFAETARVIRDHLDRLPLNDPKALMQTIGRLLARHAGGSSGALLSIMFSTAGRSDQKRWQAALKDGLTAMQDYGGARAGDRTMLDALIPAIDALDEGKDWNTVVTAARKGADATAKMKTAAAGRASYVPSGHLDNIPDPGAEAIARLFEAMKPGA